MEFQETFFWNTLWAILVSFFWFSIPGLWVARLLQFSTRITVNVSALFLAPALGMSTYGPVSLLITWSVGFSVLTVIGSWIIFQLICVLVYINKAKSGSPVPFFEIPQSACLGLLSIAICWSSLPVLDIIPLVHGEGIFVNINIFDHLKIAIVDSIVREGFPVLNPFYAPGGEKVPLIYYYGWHFLVAQVKLLSVATGWQAEVACSWFTVFAIVALLIGVAIRLSGKTRAGIFVLLLASTWVLYDGALYLLGQDLYRKLGFSHVRPLETLWIQLSWAPQHAFSSMCTVMVIFLTSRILAGTGGKWPSAVVIGLTASIGFSSSIWVGGLALLFALPVFLLSIISLKLPLKRLGLLGPLGVSFVVCVLCSIPALRSVTSGPVVSHESPLRFTLYSATSLFENNTILERIGQIVLYWVQLLPLSLGVVFVLGILAVFAYAPRSVEHRNLKVLSATSIITYLILVQFFQSAIINNDFGWRVVVVPIMWLIIWASVALTEISMGVVQKDLSHRWKSRALLVQYGRLIMPLAYIGITMGVLVSMQKIHLPGPKYSKVKHDLTLHEDFFSFRHAWEEVRKYTEPGELVQVNPKTYARTVTPWDGPATQALFGDRPTSYAESNAVETFAHSYALPQKQLQQSVVEDLFSATPSADSIAYAYNDLKIQALLVDRRDQVWGSTALEESAMYYVVSKTPKYKVYLAQKSSK
ncbi:MAG: hypothetical protein PVI97_12645 [Candidatus Thiodiazotropha sp.]